MMWTTDRTKFYVESLIHKRCIVLKTDSLYTNAAGPNLAATHPERVARLMLFDSAGPYEKLPDTKVGTFSQALYDEAKTKGWNVISMKNDWKRIFAF